MFTVMTWNVENLFPPGAKISARKRVSEDDYNGKLAYLARIIDDVRPDVVALQEIGSLADDDTRSVDDLQARLQGRYPHRALSNHPDSRRIRVAFLSRLAIQHPLDLVNFAPGELSSVADWYPRPPVPRMGRGALTIQVVTPAGARVRLTTAHLKSKLISYPAPASNPRFFPHDEHERARGAGLGLLRRTAEAVALRCQLNAVMQPNEATHTIVLGDLNDEPRAATTQLLLGPEDADATAADQLDYTRLYNLMAGIPRQGGATEDKWFLAEAESYTRIYKGHGELIDHILVSKGLLGSSEDLRQDRWRVQEVRSLVASILGQSIGDDPVERIGERRPDHAPVYARFDL
jgi:endonuclease/exonuclease/phosphatase family metal-dependent hydrolase